MANCIIVDSNGGGVYSPGETLTLQTGGNRLLYTGILSSGTKDIYFSIPLPRELTNVTSATISTLLLNIRSSLGGYLGESSWLTGGWDPSTLSKLYAYIVQPNMLSIRLYKSDGWGGTNNTTVVVAVMKLEVTFE